MLALCVECYTVIYRVAKCKIDLLTLLYSVYTGVDMTKKCQKVCQSAIKCDTFLIVNHNPDGHTVPLGCRRMVDGGAERLCVDDWSLSATISTFLPTL